MKALKILLITVLALGMSTGFAAPSVDEQTFNYSSIETIPYDDFGPEAQEDIEIAIDDYCATGDLKNYKKSNVKLAEDLLKYNRSFETDFLLSGFGGAFFVVGGLNYRSPTAPKVVLMPIMVVSAVAGVIGSFKLHKLEKNKRKADSLLKEQLEPLCESRK